MKPTLTAALLGATLLASPAIALDQAEVVKTYADLAAAGYGDSLTTAQALQGAVDALIATPSEATLTAAREAWKAARVPYQQTEVFRFGNPIVDDWEGRVNSWPLDEGLIDYVDSGAYGGPSEENPLSTLNVIATPKFSIGATEVDATTITPDTIRTLHEADGIEANVASGYHAIEFMLWGQDLNGTGPGAGARVSMGNAVVGGMTIATLFGIFLIPVLFVVVERFFSRKKKGTPEDNVTEQL